MKGESTEKPAAAASAAAAASPTSAAAPAAGTPTPAAAAAAQPSLVLLCIHKHETCVYRLCSIGHAEADTSKMDGCGN